MIILFQIVALTSPSTSQLIANANKAAIGNIASSVGNIASSVGGGLTSLGGGAVAAGGQIAGTLIANGRNNGVGNALMNVGKVAALGSLINPWIGVGAGIAMLAGGVINNLWGSKRNEANIANVKSNIVELGNFRTSASDSQSLLADWATAPKAMNFDKDYLGSEGVFSDDVTDLYDDLKSQQQTNINWVDNSLMNANKNINIENTLNTLKNMAAYGGNLMTQGANFDTGLTFINNGGTHEDNPYEGVPMGFDDEGVPNLVEEGEVIFNDYVFSKRLKVPKAIRSKYKLRGDKSLTFADAALQMSKESEERPNDSISKRGQEALLSNLINAQEEERMRKMNIENQQQANKFYDGGPKEGKKKEVQRVNFATYTPKMKRSFISANMEQIQDSLIARDFSLPQRLAILSSILHESGGDPKAVDATKKFKGIGQWGKDRYPGTEDLGEQIHSLMETSLDPSSPNWTHGGSGIPTIRRAIDGYNSFWGSTNPYEAALFYNKGYLRPKEVQARINRANEAANMERAVEANKYLNGSYIDFGDGLYQETKPFDLNSYVTTSSKRGSGTPAKRRNSKHTSSREKPEEKPEVPTYNTAGRLFPIAMNAVNVATDLAGLTNKEDYTAANAVEVAADRASKYTPVKFTPITTDLKAKHFDLDTALNRLSAETAATRRNILNTSSGNRAAAAASTLAADYNKQNTIGNILREAQQYNFGIDSQVDAAKRAVAQYNSEGAMRAAQANQQARAQANQSYMSGIIQAMQLRQAEQQAASAARSANLNALSTSIGNIGKENFMLNAINKNPALLYALTNMGDSLFKK